MISAAGTGSLLRLHSKIKATVILEKHVVPNLKSVINQLALFMQDNALCHTAKSFKTFLAEEDVTVMVWPAKSPYMIPIENVWKLLKERAKKKSLKTGRTMDYFERRMREISVDEYNPLIHSFSRRCQAVIESKDLLIKY